MHIQFGFTEPLTKRLNSPRSQLIKSELENGVSVLGERPVIGEAEWTTPDAFDDITIPHDVDAFNE